MTVPPPDGGSSPSVRPSAGPSAGPGWPARVALPVLALLVLGLAAVGVHEVSARLRPLPAPALSDQVTGLPPLDDAVQDQGHTVPLPDGRTLWIFADTAHLDGPPTFFVTSSAAVGRRGRLQVRYLADGAGAPREFLPRTRPERADQEIGRHYTAIWPTGATLLPDGRVLIAYAKYRVQQQPELSYTFVAGGLFDYRYPGLARFDSGTATRLADDIWTAADGPVASPVYRDGFVYFLRCAQYRCYSARVEPARLVDKAAYRWWDGAGWAPSRAAARALTFGSDVPGQNPAVVRDPRSKLFVMTDTTGGIQDDEGRLWVARDPWGPWSTAARFPLPQCPATGCYTLNVHPYDSPPGTLRVSFATTGVGPYVRVTDVPVEITTTGTSAPQVRTGQR